VAWPSEHKRATRERIVEAAAAEYRAKGVSGVGVAQIMSRAGLTHGGFYAHFSSKDDLLAEALERATRQTCETLEGSLGGLTARRRLLAVIDRYLSSEHAAHPDRGCPVAALAPELARADRKTRQELARSIRSRELHEDEIAGVFACMVGGLVLARGLGGAEGEAILKSCRAFLRRALGQGKGRRGGPRRPRT
jgi:TetR/AcrR family transcriptional regulator, transcriptional repressor for nem operon